MTSESSAPRALAPATVQIIIEAYDRAVSELTQRGVVVTERVRADLARTVIELAEHGTVHPRTLKTAALARFKSVR
jgi:hypothetical protein